MTAANREEEPVLLGRGLVPLLYSMFSPCPRQICKSEAHRIFVAGRWATVDGMLVSPTDSVEEAETKGRGDAIPSNVRSQLDDVQSRSRANSDLIGHSSVVP